MGFDILEFYNVDDRYGISSFVAGINGLRDLLEEILIKLKMKFGKGVEIALRLCRFGPGEESKLFAIINCDFNPMVAERMMAELDEMWWNEKRKQFNNIIDIDISWGYLRNDEPIMISMSQKESQYHILRNLH